LSYSVGFTLPDTFAQTLDRMPKHDWTPAYDGAGQVRDGAWVADVTELLDLKSWPVEIRMIVGEGAGHPARTGPHQSTRKEATVGMSHARDEATDANPAGRSRSAARAAAAPTRVSLGIHPRFAWHPS